MSANSLITLAFLALAVVVVANAHRWPLRSAIFPLLAGWSLLLLTLLKLAVDLRQWRHARVPAAIAVPSEESEEEEAEDVFARASRAEWIAALGWMGGFFGSLWLLGALIGIPMFAAAYLLIASRERPVFACAYAFACWLFVYGLFDRGLNIPLPAGVLVTALAR